MDLLRTHLDHRGRLGLGLGAAHHPAHYCVAPQAERVCLGGVLVAQLGQHRRVGAQRRG